MRKILQAAIETRRVLEKVSWLQVGSDKSALSCPALHWQDVTRDVYKQSYEAEAAMEKKYWDDLEEGEPLSCRPVVFSREDIINFAKQYDPQPFHIDEEIAKASIFGGLIASALHTISACTRVVVEAQGDLAIISGLGIEEVRLFKPVRPGDVLSVEACWSDLKRSRSKPDRGFANLRCKVSNQRGELVAEYGYKYLVACRNGI